MMAEFSLLTLPWLLLKLKKLFIINSNNTSNIKHFFKGLISKDRYSPV